MIGITSCGYHVPFVVLNAKNRPGVGEKGGKGERAPFILTKIFDIGLEAACVV